MQSRPIVLISLISRKVVMASRHSIYCDFGPGVSKFAFSNFLTSAMTSGPAIRPGYFLTSGTAEPVRKPHLEHAKQLFVIRLMAKFSEQLGQLVLFLVATLDFYIVVWGPERSDWIRSTLKIQNI